MKRRLTGARRWAPLLGSLVIASAGLAACSTGSATEKDTPDASSGVDADAFPVTIEHVYGETTIEEEPLRVATLGWSDQDAVLALGVVPVGATKLTWGGNKAGSSDWFDARVEELDGEQPVRYSDADGAPVDEIATLEPDVILATNSAITKKEYDKLSKIAPVVAYPDAPWVTSWQDGLDLVGQALGRNALADEVEAETQAVIDDAREANPELDGASVVFTYLTTTDLSTVGIYGRDDNRVRFLEELGLVSAPIVDKVVKSGQYYASISAERADEVDADVLLTYGETDEDLATFAEHDLIGQIPALKTGHAYAEVDKHVGLAITNPSPLSIPYLVEHFLPHVVAAAEGS